MRDMTALSLQRYFSAMADSQIGSATVLKIKEVLSSVLGSAKRYDLLTTNPLSQVQIPRAKVLNRKKKKPYVSPEEFHQLLMLVAEPYATMIYVSAFAGLRVSELIALRWEDVHSDSLTIDERCCRGDWSRTKTRDSCTTIGVHASVIERLERLKTLEVEIAWGGKGAKKRCKLIRSSNPEDLVFQSIRNGGPMNDQNILRRHLRPAALKLGIDPKKATWRSLRTSCATWMVKARVDVKTVQAQMRHSRASTTMDIYAQVVPEAQRKAVEQTARMVMESFHKTEAIQ